MSKVNKPNYADHICKAKDSLRPCIRSKTSKEKDHGTCFLQFSTLDSSTMHKSGEKGELSIEDKIQRQIFLPFSSDTHIFDTVKSKYKE